MLIGILIFYLIGCLLNLIILINDYRTDKLFYKHKYNFIVALVMLLFVLLSWFYYVYEHVNEYGFRL